MDFFSSSQTFEGMYQNPLAVLFAFFFLIFIFTYIALRAAFKKQKNIAVVVSLCVSALAIWKFREMILGLNIFNTLLALSVIVVFFVLGKPFWKFVKREWGAS